jgi:hypothetical protein
MPTTIPGNQSAVTRRVRQHRASAGMIRVEVEVPTRDDALAVRRFALARRRARKCTPLSAVDVSAAPTARSSDDLPAVLTGMDAARQTIALLFGQALAQTTAPDMLARGRRIAINFADAVEQRGRSVALRDDNGSE